MIILKTKEKHFKNTVLLREYLLVSCLVSFTVRAVVVQRLLANCSFQAVSVQTHSDQSSNNIARQLLL